MSSSQNNVYGKPLKLCSSDPLTGWYRSGYCETDKHDFGRHCICSVMTKEFLDYSASKGNDLSRVVDVGEKWCLCVSRWKEAYIAGKAPLVDLEATNIKTLDEIDLDTLSEFDVNKQNNVDK